MNTHSVRDAARLARILFLTMDWKWGSDDNAHVPTVDEIEETFKYLARCAEEHEAAATGRLLVRLTDLGLEYSIELHTDYGMDDDE